MTTRILVTGFEPFGGSDDNPSMRIVHALADDPPAGVELATGVLPVTWAGAWPGVFELMGQHRPDVVLMLGQSGKRSSVTVERFALNFGRGRIADNDGVDRPDGGLVDGAPLALASTIDVDGVVEAMTSAGVQARPSHDAGACVCNLVLFHSLLHATPGQQAGFIHVPMLPGQKGTENGEPTMDAAESGKAVRAAIEFVRG